MKKSFTYLTALIILSAGYTTVKAQDDRSMEKRDNNYQNNFSYPPERNHDEHFYGDHDQRGHEELERYYYYPESNIYCDLSDNHFIYNDGRNWINVASLPFNISIGRSTRIMVCNNGGAIWNQNSYHRHVYNGFNQCYQTPVVYYNHHDRDDRWRRDFRRDEWRFHDRDRH